tara:strand:+ start:29186 stop:29617 length:432 start_codon:yes stop_codon:yes gene_type:complete
MVMKNKKITEPYIITFPKIGDDNIGFISVCENYKEIPFTINRVFWTYNTPANVTRGNHAHFESEQVLLALNGIIKLTLETINGKTYSFILDTPNKGIYIPIKTWIKMEYLNEATQLVLASTKYDESEYIRDYNKFKQMQAVNG